MTWQFPKSYCQPWKVSGNPKRKAVKRLPSEPFFKEQTVKLRMGVFHTYRSDLYPITPDAGLLQWFEYLISFASQNDKMIFMHWYLPKKPTKNRHWLALQAVPYHLLFGFFYFATFSPFSPLFSRLLFCVPQRGVLFLLWQTTFRKLPNEALTLAGSSYLWLEALKSWSLELPSILRPLIVPIRPLSIFDCSWNLLMYSGYAGCLSWITKLRAFRPKCQGELRELRSPGSILPQQCNF